jgi:thiol:disulfide interchange protein DsbC
MRRVLLLAVISFLLIPAGSSFGFSSKGQDCSRCHTLKKEEAASLLKGIIANPKILDIRTIPFKSVWELDIDSGGRKGIVYLDFSKKYLISGSVIDIKAKKDLTRDRFSEINMVDVSKIPLQDALVMGNKNAGRRVIVFDDPD